MSAQIPVMRQFKHPELAKVKLPGETLTRKDLDELVRNTNFLIQKNLHVPGLRLTHEGREDRPDMKGRALGWAEKLTVSGDSAIAQTEFTPSGKSMILNKEVRWVSSGIKRDFKLTGEPDGPVLPGLYLDHVAVLGDENPAVKGLVDLTQIQLAEGKLSEGREHFAIFEDGEISYFAETSDIRKEIDVMPEEKKDSDSAVLAMFKETQNQNLELRTKIAQLETEIKTKDAEVANLKQEKERAQFAEHSTSVDDLVNKTQKDKNLGAEFTGDLKKQGRRAFGNAEAMESFKSLLKNIPVQVSKKRVLDEDEDKSAEFDDEKDEQEAKFSEQIAKLSETDLNMAARDIPTAQKIHKILKFRQIKNPKYGLGDLRNEIKAKRS